MLTIGSEFDGLSFVVAELTHLVLRLVALFENVVDTALFEGLNHVEVT